MIATCEPGKINMHIYPEAGKMGFSDSFVLLVKTHSAEFKTGKLIHCMS